MPTNLNMAPSTRTGGGGRRPPTAPFGLGRARSTQALHSFTPEKVLRPPMSGVATKLRQSTPRAVSGGSGVRHLQPTLPAKVAPLAMAQGRRKRGSTGRDSPLRERTSSEQIQRSASTLLLAEVAAAAQRRWTTINLLTPTEAGRRREKCRGAKLAPGASSPKIPGTMIRSVLPEDAEQIADL